MKKALKVLMSALVTLFVLTAISCSEPEPEPTPSPKENFIGTWRGSINDGDENIAFVMTVGNNNITVKLTIDFVPAAEVGFENYSINGETVSGYLAGDYCRIGKLSGNTFMFNYYEDISIYKCTLYKD